MSSSARWCCTPSAGAAVLRAGHGPRRRGGRAGGHRHPQRPALPRPRCAAASPSSRWRTASCEIRQDERQTFASVVHDDIIQSVVGARYLLGVVPRPTTRTRPRRLLDEAVGVLQQTVIDARRIVWELRPPVLDELGLEASLAALGQHLGNAPEARRSSTPTSATSPR